MGHMRGHVYCSVCRSRITGTMLNYKYRYYRCVGTKPTSAHKAICCEAYIKADWPIKRGRVTSYETKLLALDALDVKVYATRDNVNIHGVIPVDLVTIAQTSA